VKFRTYRTPNDCCATCRSLALPAAAMSTVPVASEKVSACLQEPPAAQRILARPLVSSRHCSAGARTARALSVQGLLLSEVKGRLEKADQTAFAPAHAA